MTGRDSETSQGRDSQASQPASRPQSFEPPRTVGKIHMANAGGFSYYSEANVQKL